MAPHPAADTDPLFDFAPEPPRASKADLHEDHWKILIVDDEPEVHGATLLALQDVRMEGRRFVSHQPPHPSVPSGPTSDPTFR